MSNKHTRELTMRYAVRLGDDALILGHRLSEWCRNGPYLEEDLALSNVALDYIGRARMYYGYASELCDGEKSEDDFAFLRDCREYENLLITELPRGDFAYTLARQLVLDQFYSYFLGAMRASTDETLAAIAAKAAKETRYHLRRSTDWALRLGDGTEESHRRYQQALDALWGYIPEMFEQDELEKELAEQGIAVDTPTLQADWEKDIRAILGEATLTVPEQSWVVRGGRTGFHTEHLGHLLSELQYLQRTYPGLQW